MVSSPANAAPQRSGPAVHPCAALPLLRNGLSNLTCMTPRGNMVFPCEGIRRSRGSRNRRGGTLHGPCTVFPTMFIAELEHPEFARFDLTSLRTGIMAGAALPPLRSCGV